MFLTIKTIQTSEIQTPNSSETNYDTPLPRFAAIVEVTGAPTGKLCRSWSFFIGVMIGMIFGFSFGFVTHGVLMASRDVE
jgi:vacuolar-type H+-ATPase subunit I/STV1